MGTEISFILYASWPVFIFVAYLFVRYNIKKLED